MDFSTKYTVRTDMADEVVEKLKTKEGILGDGIFFETKNVRGITVDTVRVESDNAYKTLGKSKGTYITVNVGDIRNCDRESFERCADVLCGCIKPFLPKKGLCLAVCLGNKKISADAIGPFVAEGIIVSRHIKLKDRSLFSSLSLGECACIVPGVMGNTGAEALEIVKGAVDNLKPDFVIAIDSLASRNLSRLARTVQISSCGISPGSGVGNTRDEISEKTLGVPTISIGVPTVVEALTLSLDLLSEALGDEKEVFEFVEKKISQNIGTFFVCPKETDKIIRSMSRLVAYSVNLAVHENLTVSDIDEFLS